MLPKYYKILAALITLSLPALAEQVSITVFIHGAVAPGAALLSPIAFVRQKLNKKSFYGKVARRVRAHEKMREDWPMLDEGMIEISPEILTSYHENTLDPELGKFAAYQLAGAYDYFESKLTPDDTHRYFFYGHNGLLNEKDRRKAGKELYTHLVALQNEYTQEDDIAFNLLGHSHGGTIGLYTALGKPEDEKCPIKIRQLILLGTPLQKEQAELITDPFFESIYNFYSLGDAMQTKDYVSTPSRKSFAKLTDVISQNTYAHANVFDIELSVEEDKTAITHHTLWLLGKYDNAVKMKRKATQQKIKGVFDLISPLPIAAYTPLLVAAIGEKSKPIPEKLDLRISEDAPGTITIWNEFYIAPGCVVSQGVQAGRSFMVATDSCLTQEDLAYVTSRAKEQWQPYAVCSELAKHKLILKSAWRTLLRK